MRSVRRGVSGSDGTAIATCPTGQAITGGGFKRAGHIASSYPVINTWHPAFLSGVVGPALYTAYAVCATAGLSAAPGSANSSSAVANNAAGVAQATCTAKQLLTGGGYADANGAFPIITDLTLAAATFAVKTANLYAPATTGPGGTPPTPAPLQVTAYGICVTPT